MEINALVSMCIEELYLLSNIEVVIELIIHGDDEIIEINVYIIYLLPLIK